MPSTEELISNCREEAEESNNEIEVLSSVCHEKFLVSRFPRISPYLTHLKSRRDKMNFSDQRDIIFVFLPVPLRHA